MANVNLTTNLQDNLADGRLSYLSNSFNLKGLTNAQIAALTPTLGDLVRNSDENVYQSWNGTSWETVANLSNLAYGSLIFVDSIDKLPAPVAGEYILPPNGDFYIFTRNIDLGGDTLVVNNNSLMASSAETAGLVNAYVVINDTCQIKYFRFENSQININDPTGAYDWAYLNFYNCPNAIQISAADNIVWSVFGFINSHGLSVNGTLNSFVFKDSIFRSVTEPTASFLTFGDLAIINRRVRIEDSVFATSNALQTALTINPLASIQLESFLCEDLRFTGVGTALNGINGNDDRAIFTRCVGTGVINTAIQANLYMKNNATPTTVLVINDRYEVAGTKLVNSSFLQRFELVSNRLRYTSDLTRQVKIEATITLSSAANNVIGVYVGILRAPNTIDPNADRISESENYVTMSGTRPDNASLQCINELNQGDEVYIICQNQTGVNDITVSFLNVIVTEV